MTLPDAKAWTPEQRHFDTAHVLSLARRLGVADYDSLLKLSVERPADYWQAANDFLGIAWDTRPKGGLG